MPLYLNHSQPSYVLDTLRCQTANSSFLLSVPLFHSSHAQTLYYLLTLVVPDELLQVNPQTSSYLCMKV